MKSTRFLLLALLMSSFMSVAAYASSSFVERPVRPSRISGYVLDSVSRRPIAAVLVRLASEQGCEVEEALTNSQGYFVLQPTWRPEGANYVMVRTVYHEGRTLIGSGEPAEIEVLLHRNRFRFAAASCGQLADSVRVNPYASQCLFGHWPSKGFQSFYISNPSKRPAGYLRTITFDEAKMGNICSQFRLRIYSVDSLTREPRWNILTENVMLCLFRSPSRLPKLITYDISSFKIPVPADGFYLGLEEVIGSDKFYPCPPALHNYSPTGTILRAPCTYEQCRTWTWKNIMSAEGYWTPPTENCWPLYESALSVEVEAVPSLPAGR